MPLKLELAEVVLKTHEFLRLTAFYDLLLDAPRCRYWCHGVHAP